MPWRLPAWAERILPLAVILKRFLQEDLFFILGILPVPSLIDAVLVEAKH
jgi:hypothetical protein